MVPSVRPASGFRRFVPKTAAGKYALGLALAGTGALVQILLRALLDTLDPSGLEPFTSYQAFMAAVALSAILCGRRVGFFCLGISALILLYIFIPPIFSLRIETPVVALQLGLFLAVGSIICLLGGALHRSEEAFDTVLGSIGDAVVATDRTGAVAFTNAAAETLIGLAPGAAVGRPVADVISLAEETQPGSIAGAAAGITPTGTTAASVKQARLKARDGREIPVEAIESAIRDSSGAVTGTVTVLRDVSELRASNERTRLIVDTALDAVVTMDAAGVIAGWNPQAERTFGWSRRDAVGRDLADTIVPERYRAAHRAGLVTFLSTGTGPVLNRRLELIALHRDGREFPIELSITPIASGGTVTFSAFVRDITEREQMQQSVVESRQHYQALAESLPNLVWTCRADGYCDYLSRQWLEYTGRDVDSQVGFGWIENVHPDDRAGVQSAWAEATTRGTVYDVEFRIRRADGVYRWFKTRAVPFRDGTGEIVKWFGSNTDIDAAKQAEQRLRAQLERLHLLDRLTRATAERHDLRAVLDVVIRSLEDDLPVDFCCACLYDPAAQSLTVIHVGPKSQFLSPRLDMAEGSRIDVDRDGLSRSVRGELVYEPDLTRLTAPFSERLVRGGLRSVVVAPLMVEGSALGAMIAARAASGFTSTDCEFLRQLSEHVALAAHQARLHTALQQAYDDLRQTQQIVMQQERLKALGQMSSGIAHDINNAMTPAAIYLEWLLEDEPVSPQGREHLETIRRAIDDVAQTVARMRDFSRLRDSQPLQATVDVNRLVRQVIDLSRARWNDIAQQRGAVIEIALDLAPDAPPVMGVESEIRDALINLVLNAADAMPAGGTLTVRTRAVRAADAPAATPRQRAQVEISDTGTGMNAETRRRCLEPFFTTKGERGTGLGLAMVYGMAQRHGADLDIDSHPGKGTAVRLTFDVPTDEDPAPVRSADAAARPSRLRLLVVDDDPLLLKSLTDVLASDAHLVTPAAGGQAGITLFREAVEKNQRFDLVITDLGMPYVDGRQVAMSVKAASPSTPVVLLTGWGRGLDDAETVAHVDRVLSKPPKLAELRRTLAELT